MLRWAWRAGVIKHQRVAEKTAANATPLAPCWDALSLQSEQSCRSNVPGSRGPGTGAARHDIECALHACSGQLNASRLNEARRGCSLVRGSMSQPGVHTPPALRRAPLVAVTPSLGRQRSTGRWIPVGSDVVQRDKES